MKNSSFAISADVVTEVVLAVCAIMVLTALMLLLGRPLLGEAVIAMLYLLAVGWFTSHSGPMPGLSAAVAAALMFAYFFVPPFFTFTVGSVEGWLMLVIFVLVAVLLVDRFRAGLAQARVREQEALLLYELSMALVGRHSRAEIAVAVAERLQQLYQAAQVQVMFLSEGDAPSIMVRVPDQTAPAARPDHVVPLLAARCLVGEIRVWSGAGGSNDTAARVLRLLAGQMALALERLAPAR